MKFRPMVFAPTGFHSTASHATAFRASAFHCAVLLGIGVIWAPWVASDELTIVPRVPRQPLASATERLIQAMEASGSPLDPAVLRRVRVAAAMENESDASRAIQAALDPICLAEVHINPESRVKVIEGPANKTLLQQGWRLFLIKVHNQAGINPALNLTSPNMLPVHQKGKHPRERPRTDEQLVNPSDIPERWLDASMLDRPPLKSTLSGLAVEYRAVLLFSRDAGQREALLSFDIGQGTKDIGFRSAIPILFDCRPAVEVVFHVQDDDGSPTMASLIIRDAKGRVYPNRAKRLAPDFFFHDQVYRRHGESVFLPPGRYSITASRGPEYIPVDLNVDVPTTTSFTIDVPLRRWTHLAKKNWFSGDHHVHAAGCSHYDSPTEGVGPEDMMRHLVGEDVNVGCVLSWGPCWYTQKQFFQGRVSPLSTRKNVMRYDVEVSGFPSSHAGHLCLLHLSEDDYPGAELLEDWPSWTLPVLKWGQQQGGVVGYSHSGWGLALPDVMPDGSRRFVGRPWGGAGRDWKGSASDRLPDYAMPKFDGIGANEYVVTTAHGACDFISAVDTPAIWELNVWYHTLNCGMTTRISGETDFPCIYDDRVGLGRAYVKVDDAQNLSFDNWVAGLKDGRSYCGDGLSHIIDFQVDGHELGTRDSPDSSPSRIDINAPRRMSVSFNASAFLSPQTTEATETIRGKRLDEKPYWHLERCRIAETRNVSVEVIVNGEVASEHTLLADGSWQTFETVVDIKESSWIAVRILPSVHTNPIFVHVDGAAIRANARSAQWCLDAVDQCWKSKSGQIRDSERAEARRAYDQAKKIYESILSECKSK